MIYFYDKPIKGFTIPPAFDAQLILTYPSYFWKLEEIKEHNMFDVLYVSAEEVWINSIFRIWMQNLDCVYLNSIIQMMIYILHRRKFHIY